MAKRELLATMRDHYRSSSKKDKSRILDECIAVTGHHRKHGIKLLGKRGDDGDTSHPVRSRRIYDEAVSEAVIVIWEAAGRIWGKWLKSALPHLLESMERHGHLALDPEVRVRLLGASAATLDRLLKPIRPVAGSRRRRRRKQMKDALKEYRARLDPVLLLHTIREAQSALVAATAPKVRETPTGESLEYFLAKLPRLWCQGEVRPTHAAKVRGPRHWRTREDPFEGVWGDVLMWLQAEPDATGKALMARLQSECPDRFTEAQLRTMQRRMKEWRGIMAKKLVYAGTDEA